MATTGVRRLRALLRVSGTVAAVMGSYGAVVGPGSVREPKSHARNSAPPVSASVESEFRFFAAWYATSGAVALSVSRSDRIDVTTARILAAGWAGAAAARIIGMRRAGQPHAFFRALTVVELGVAASLAVLSGHGS